MASFIESPDTIRNKVNEFKTAFSGYRKDEVANYISILAEQQGVMISLLKENNIPLSVDSGYNQETQFNQPLAEAQEYLTQFKSEDVSEDLVLLQQELARVKAENEELKSTAYPFTNSKPNIAGFEAELEEKNAYIAQLEAQLANSQVSEVVTIDESVEQSYKDRIAELEAKLIELEESNSKIKDDCATLREEVKSLENSNKEKSEELALANELLHDSDVNLEEFLSKRAEIIKSEQNEDLEEQLSSLTLNIEVLEDEVTKLTREKRNLEVELEKKDAEIKQYTSYKNEEGVVITLDPNTLKTKHNEIIELQKQLVSEKEALNAKEESLKELETKIEKNKHLISEDYVNEVTAKEREVDRLRAQMEKMLVVAQATAEETEKEATAKANKSIEEATAKATALVEEAKAKKAELEAAAESTIANANEFKEKSEAELNAFREETRKNAEEIILVAQEKSEEIIGLAQQEAEKTKELAIEEVDKIMKAAEDKVTAIDEVIAQKQKEVDDINKYYLKIKNDGIVGVKKLYNALEAIIYNTDLDDMKGSKLY